MRFLFRLLSLVALAIAVLAAAIDSIESVASSEVVMTSFGAAWADLSSSTLALVQTGVEHYIGAWIWQNGVAWVLGQPAFAVFLLLSLFLWMCGYRKPSLAGRFAA
ncbi:hypothetical protein HFC70_03155 [Agrobacterium sp. a22-2]|uniref:hypothetical protein n=1 Tax=Agrobacterium sp. a22-2 TaxID=2283840 RepID=UPI001446E171|nr:hypothetical protein [Agrobacterium sp. a22-2]